MTPGAFVEVLAEVLGEPRESVVVADRVLAKAKLRSVGGRGLSAARITAEDAAVILVAVMVSRVLTRADEEAVRWRNVKSLSLPSKAPERLRSLLPATIGEPLIDGLSRLIAVDPNDWRDMHIVLDLDAAMHTAELRFELGGKRSQKFSAHYAAFLEDGEAPEPARGDLWRRASVTGETFKTLHRAVFDNPVNGDAG